MSIIVFTLFVNTAILLQKEVSHTFWCETSFCAMGYIVYYGVAFVLYMTGVWTPTLTGIALLFGIGNAFDSIVSMVVYIHFLKK